MEYSLLIGSAGSAPFLLAFFLTVFGKLRIDSETYPLMNFAGAALSRHASLLIDYHKTGINPIGLKCAQSSCFEQNPSPKAGFLYAVRSIVRSLGGTMPLQDSSE
jgi:hypothetical protein